ncbi:PfkB family carbohydrate kinase, partial [Rhodobaculum claviforme]
PPAVLRMDDAEAEGVAGRTLPAPADTADFAAALVARGVARTVVIARGADGNVLVRDGLRLHCRPPRVEVLSKVGAGDSFMGAFTLEIAGGADGESAQGPDWAQALRRGTAAAAAAVMTPGTELCSRADTDRLAPECHLTEI